MLPTMPHTSLEVIGNEHQALAAMLRSMSMLLMNAHREKRPPPFDVLRAMLFYVDEFPERLHHRKESELLFPKVRERCPELGAVLDRLEMPTGAGVSGLESDGADLFYCGGGPSGTVRAVRRPKGVR